MKVRFSWCPHHGKSIVWENKNGKEEGTCPDCKKKWQFVEIPMPPNPFPPEHRDSE
jgi:hypothetical protein